MAAGGDSDRKNPLWPVAGYWTAFLVNLLALAPTIPLVSEGVGILEDQMAWIPWLINLAIIVGALWKWPGFALGYLLGLSVAFAAALTFIPSCTAACKSGIAIGTVGGLAVFLGLMALYVFFWISVGIFFSLYAYRQARKSSQSSPTDGGLDAEPGASGDVRQQATRQS